MPSSPPPTLSALRQEATKFVVLVGDEDGSNPTLDDEVDYLIPLTMIQTGTGRRDDVMTFGYLDQPRLVDTTTPVGMKTQIELRALDEDDEPTIILGWGQMARQPQRIDGDSEMVQMEVRIGDQHFGRRLSDYPVFDPITESGIDVQRDLIFNPEIDGLLRPNMLLGPLIDDLDLVYYFVDWDAISTVTASAFQDQVHDGGPPNDYWTPIHAILTLCRILNPDEEFITNPTAAEIYVPDGSDETLIKNCRIPMGASLPEALDVLLIPLELGWHLVYSLNGDDERETKFEFYKRGEGLVKHVKMQRPEEYRDITETNVVSFDATYSVIDLANRIEAYGDLEKREYTFRLQKGWKTEDDVKLLHELAVGSPLYNTSPEIGRRWVLNEAGDYIDYRTELTDPFDWDPVGFDQRPTVRRRRFLRCLSQHVDADDEESNGYRVDWYDTHRIGAADSDVSTDPGWVRVKWPFTMLEKECGIFFTGTTPPEPLWRLVKAGTPDLAMVRITATVAGDTRVSKICERPADSVNGLDMTLCLDVSDKFQKSVVTAGSIFTGAPTEARDDTDALEDWALEVQVIEDVMRLDCSILLEGCLHADLSIGDTLEDVEGRNLSLALNAAGRLPQIVGFAWDFQAQRLEILLESFRKERPTVVTGNPAARRVVRNGAGRFGGAAGF